MTLAFGHTEQGKRSKVKMKDAKAKNHVLASFKEILTFFRNLVCLCEYK